MSIIHRLAKSRRSPAFIGAIALLLVGLLAAGCGGALAPVGSGNEVVIAPDANGNAGGLPDASGDGTGAPAILPNPGDERVTITLFFNSRSGLLDPWPWRRTVDRPQQVADLGRMALEHLLQPPPDSPFVSALPKGTRILSVEVDDSQQLAYVNFSRELVENHPGGSYGEATTLHAIVQTLTGIPGIRRVQILVEGKTIDTLAGHISTREPLERMLLVPGPGPDGSPVPAARPGSAANGSAGGEAAAAAAGPGGGNGSGGTGPTDPGHGGKAGWNPWQMETDAAVMDFFQAQVDQGRMQWLTDPVEAARYLTTTYGFFGWDEFVLLHRTDRGEGSGLGEALVRVRHGNSYYTVHMIQPRRQGEQGIWVVHDIRSRAVLTGRKPVDPDLVRAWQEEVDGGANLWRLDPVDTVRRQGGQYGFDPYSDEFSLIDVNTGTGRALVGVKHDGREYQVHLVQPVRRGERGVWWIESIAPAPDGTGP